MENRFSFSKGFAAWLGTLQATLCFSSYDTGFVYFVGTAQGNIQTSYMQLPRPMGLANAGNSLWIGTAAKITRYENAIPFGKTGDNAKDAVYVPRVAFSVGSVDAHELIIEHEDTAVFANTRFSCVAAISDKKNFSIRWKPEFITAIVPEDRCHLNGIAIRDGNVRYVTMFSSSDSLMGWKHNGSRNSGGFLMDILTGEICIPNLSMPHSPRWHDEKLWVLDSGRGYLNGPGGNIVFCPGFLRGLSFSSRYAVVTVSKPRDGMFHGLELQRELAVRNTEPMCGICVIDLEAGGIVEWLKIDGPMRELFDVVILPNRNATAFAPETPQAMNLFMGVN